MSAAPRLLAIDEMPAVPGLSVPRDLYCVLREPAPLFGMPWPGGLSAVHWQALHAAGARHVVCLAAAPPLPYDPAPLAILTACELEDLVHGGPPHDPARELALIDDATRLVLERLHADEGVVIHCIGGRGRTGTVMARVLVRIGTAPSDAIRYLHELHVARGRAGWPEAAWQGEVVGGGN